MCYKKLALKIQGAKFLKVVEFKWNVELFRKSCMVREGSSKNLITKCSLK